MPKARSIPGLSPGPPGGAELKKVERLLEKLAPEHSHLSASLVNALLVQAQGPSQGPALHSIRHNLLFLVSPAATRRLAEALDALILAARFEIDDGEIVAHDAAGQKVTHSFTDSMIDFAAFLRYDLGLSVLYVYRYLKEHHGAPTPPAALFACIARVRPS